MSWMIEVYFSVEDAMSKHDTIAQCEALGGQVTFREGTIDSRPFILTVEFSNDVAASSAADELRDLGFHVEGPGSY